MAGQTVAMRPNVDVYPNWLVRETGRNGAIWYHVRLFHGPNDAPHYYGPFESRDVANQFCWTAVEKLGVVSMDINVLAMNMSEEAWDRPR